MRLKLFFLLLPAALALAPAGCRKGPDVGQRWPEGDRKVIGSARLSCDVGQAKHAEDSNLRELKSDWESIFVRPRLLVEARTKQGLEFSGEFSWMYTDEEEEEEWKLAGDKISENEMGISGHEFRLLGGWGLDIERFGRVTLLGGFSGRFLELERKMEDGERTEFDADLYLWEIEGRLALPLTKPKCEFPITMEASASYGRVIDPEADIDGAVTIDGNHAWLFRTRAGLDFQLTRHLSVYVGGFYENLRIDGGVEDNYEWADSDSTAGGGEIGLRARF